MRKIVNQNLLLLGIPAALVLAAGILLFLDGEKLFQLSQSMAPELPKGEVSDVEGYGFLAGFFTFGLGSVSALVVQIIAIIIMIYSGIMLIFCIVARTLYRTTPGRIVVYRILIGINLFLFLLPVPEYIRSFYNSAVNGSFSSGLLICLVLVCLLAALVIRNTYTSRVKQ